MIYKKEIAKVSINEISIGKNLRTNDFIMGDNEKFSKIFSRQDWKRIGQADLLYKALSHEKSKILNLPITGDIQFPLGWRPHCCHLRGEYLEIRSKFH